MSHDGAVLNASLAAFSALNQATMKQHLAAGRAFVREMDGSHPTPEQIAELRIAHAEVGLAIDRAVEASR